MPTVKLSKRTVDAAQPGETDTYFWDDELRGFGLKVTPKGTKTYLVQYRVGGRGGRTRRVTLGRHGPVTPDQARQEALKTLGAVAGGLDVAEEKTRTRKDLTMAQLLDLWMAEGCDHKKASTLKIDRSNIERHIKPLIGTKRLNTLTRTDVERMQRAIAEGKTAADIKTGTRGRAVVEGGRGTAARCLAILGAALTFAVQRDLRPDNPVRGVQAYKGQKKEPFLSMEELDRLGAALREAEQTGTNPFAIAAIRLMLLTGCRKSEILTLRWEWVDFERGCLRLPESKTGAKVVPVADAPLALLRTLPRVAGNPHVLPSSKSEGHLVGLQKVWESLRVKADLADVRLHDLRHSFASAAVAQGESLFLVGKVLGHRQARTTEVYAHLQDDPVRGVANRTADTLIAMLGEK
ncbi:tyrosine-type recombinase/integrase [Roseospira navarrensis]|uniref:Tyrosine-type recombinase/integrase n=1 Tax=Roseospira navarrensis TaxID=140058 RepID=A0A7X1ZCC8_9PROT|nr:site-specific integrase [Roseospira navarrensis]MQX35960.1 tyrosine-type recombinase/integrase [Roseospira navarrensis]